jgi:hypothetical protein
MDTSLDAIGQYQLIIEVYIKMFPAIRYNVQIQRLHVFWPCSNFYKQNGGIFIENKKKIKSIILYNGARPDHVDGNQMFSLNEFVLTTDY